MTWPLPSLWLAVAAVVTASLLLLVPDLGRTDVLGIGIDNRFLSLNATLLMVAVIDGFLAPSPAGVTFRRHHPRVMTLDQESTITWEVEAPSGRRQRGAAKRVWVADQLAPSLQAATRRVQLTLPARGMSSATVTLQPTRRGRFEPSEVVIRTSGPLGLVHKQRRRSEPTILKVLPPFRSAKEAELSLRRARVLEVGLRSAQGRGGGTEFDSLRELTPDDETRRIDWAATARSQRPIVRTYRAERNQTVLCLLDSGRTMAGRVLGVPRMEFAMDGAMLLAELATGLGDRMGLVSFDQEINTTIEPSNRRSQRARISEQLFDLEPALAESNYQTAVTHVLGRYRRRSFLVILTELGQEAVEQFLVPALPLLIRTHVVVVAAVRDPDLVRWSSSSSYSGDGDSGDGVFETGPSPSRNRIDEDRAFLRSASITALHDREVLAARLRAMGAVVIDMEPSAFATALGDAYLDAKATGRL